MTGAIRITDPEKVRHALCDLRNLFRVSNVELARDAGFRQEQVSRWLCGRAVPDLTTVVRLAHALGYDLALVPRKTDPGPGE